MAECFGFLSGKEIVVVVDIDETIYTEPAYTSFRQVGELKEIALILGLRGISQSREVVVAKRHKLEQQYGREITLTETVYALGITHKEWDRVRNLLWQPENWLRTDIDLCRALDAFRAAGTMSLCFASNAPLEKARQTLRALGIRTKKSIKVFAPENLGCSKPDPLFFLRIAEKLRTPPAQCIAIGDRKMSDVDPAIAAGFSCGFVVQGQDDFIGVLHKIAGRRES